MSPPLYPSRPGHSYCVQVDQLLDLSAIGIELTEGDQFIPEQTTAAIDVHHPAAKYYALTGTGAADRQSTLVETEAEALVGAAVCLRLLPAERLPFPRSDVVTTLLGRHCALLL